MLPMMLLRRFHCVLAPTEPKVLAKAQNYLCEHHPEASLHFDGQDYKKGTLATTASGMLMNRVDHLPAASPVAQAGRPRLRVIQDPISKLNPEMLYRQIQYLVEEGDWGAHGQEVTPVGGGAQ
jgi:hypothetical protein